MLVFSLVLSGSAISQEDGRDIVVKGTGYYPVSFFELMHDPAKFDGRKVEVFGYLHVQFEDCTLYALRDFADYGIELNGILVSFKDDVKIISKKPLGKDTAQSLEKLNGSYLLLRGKFVNRRYGQFGYLFGALHVDEVLIPKRFFDGKRKLR
jgi:hypothetical protein